MAVNSVSLVGRLVNDPESGQTKNGKTMCKFCLAVDKWGKDAGANFINCVVWDKKGETISQYVKKGQLLAVQGRLDQSSYEKDGKKQSFISVIVDDFSFMGGKGGNDNSEKPSSQNSAGVDNGWDETVIPF